MKATIVVSLILTVLSPIYAAQADFELTVLHTNDLHSRVEAINKYDSTCSAEDKSKDKCLGGFARLKTAVAQQRELAQNSLLVDGGDVFQGSLFYTYYKGKAAAELMNSIGYDGMTVGNHEFDDGPETLASFVKAIEFPILLSNADITREPSIAGKIEAYSVVNRGGVDIGLIGLTPVDTAELSSPGKLVHFIEPERAVSSAVQALQADGVNIIIVLSHSGYRQDLRIAENVDGIDIIVGGHSNSYLSNGGEGAVGPYPTMVGNTAVVQAYAYGKFLGVLNAKFDDAGNVIDASGEPVLLDASIEPDAELAARIVELAAPLEEIRNEIVSDASTAINGNRDSCRVQECAMGNLIADAMLDRVTDQGVSVAIQNSGGIRASIDAGEITMGEVLTVLPFQNTLSTFELSGADIIAALENGVSQVEEGKGRFPQVAGLKFSWSRQGQSNGGRIHSTKVQHDGDWQDIDPLQRYGVVSNNFLRNGGDGYSVFADRADKAYDFGPGLETVLADYLKKNSPYKPYTDSRIVERK